MKLFYLFLCFVAISNAQQCSCPDSCSNKEELGRGTWFLLHSIVKNVEKTPDNEMLFYDFIDILSMLYPCEECRQHFIDNLENMKTIEMSEKWMCNFHNTINIQLNKTIHPCHSIK